MSRNLFYKVLIALLFVGVAIVWLLSANGTLPEEINLNWVLAVFAGGLGIVFILKGVFQKNISIIKKFNIFFGGALIAAGVLPLIGIAIEDKLVLPIIAIILTAAILLSILVVGGKKWDSGDNQNAGYKNYYQRKEEEEKKNRDNKR